MKNSENLPKNVFSDKATNYNAALATLVTVFFFWGFIAAGNGVLIPFCKTYFNLDQFQSQLIDFAFYGAYYMGALMLFVVSSLKKTDIMNKWMYRITALVKDNWEAAGHAKNRAEGSGKSRARRSVPPTVQRLRARMQGLQAGAHASSGTNDKPMQIPIWDRFSRGERPTTRASEFCRRSDQTVSQCPVKREDI